MDESIPSTAWLELPRNERLVLRGTCAIGRSPSNPLVLPDEKVSRRHAIIHPQEQNQLWLVDLGSSNGTYLNGRRVTRPLQLRDGDQIEIGQHRIVFHQSAEPGRVPASADSEKTIQEVKAAPCWLLVADIEQSTRLSRKLSPEQLPVVTGRWLAECKQIVEECGGTINKFLGDGFFAYWYDRERTVLNVARALEALKRLQSQAQPPFRVVIHFGEVCAGAGASLGEESLLGNEVNFVFRLERLAARLARPRLMSEPARERLSANLAAEDAGQHAVAGFDGEFAMFAF
jgi:adenylate cyclase